LVSICFSFLNQPAPRHRSQGLPGCASDLHGRSESRSGTAPTSASFTDYDSDDGFGIVYVSSAATAILGNGHDADIDDAPDFWGDFAERAHAT